MEKGQGAKSTDLMLGKLTGIIEMLIVDIKRLNGDLKTHIRDHKAGFYWLIPTLISLATLTVLILHFWSE